MDLPTLLQRHTIKKKYYSQGRDPVVPGSISSMSRIPSRTSFDSLVSAERQLASRTYGSLESLQPSTERSPRSVASSYPSYDPTTYDSVESLYREARNLRPLYDNLYDYEAYGEDVGEIELVRRLKAFYRRHKPTFLLIEFMIQFGLCTLALSL